MNINLSKNDTLLRENNKNIVKGTNKISTLEKKYFEFWNTFEFKQIIQSPTGVTQSTSSLIHHILINTNEKLAQFGQISDRLLDFQKTKKKQKKRVDVHKQIYFRSFKKYSIDEYGKALDINKVHTDIFNKLVEAVNKIAPLKTVKIKNTSSEWFHKEIAEKLSLRDKLFKKFKADRLNIDWEIYKEARNGVQRLII